MIVSKAAFLQKADSLKSLARDICSITKDVSKETFLQNAKSAKYILTELGKETKDNWPTIAMLGGSMSAGGATIMSASPVIPLEEFIVPGVAGAVAFIAGVIKALNDA